MWLVLLAQRYQGRLELTDFVLQNSGRSPHSNIGSDYSHQSLSPPSHNPQSLRHEEYREYTDQHFDPYYNRPVPAIHGKRGAEVLEDFYGDVRKKTFQPTYDSRKWLKFILL